jgi:hypothetical protein
VKIRQDIRANVIVVLSRVREARTMDDICWHLPDMGRHEVAFTIDVMALRGEIEIVADKAPLRYRLRQELYHIPEQPRGWHPEDVVPRLTLAIISIGLVALAIILWRSMP